MLTWLALSVLVGTPAVGEIAPDFVVKDTEQQTLKLSELVKSGPVVLAFFPKAFTSGCTQELTTYTQRFAELQKSQARVIAVSTDDLETQKKFKAELKAPFSFVADADGKLTSLYDVKTPVVTYAKRRTFVIGRDMKIVRIDEGSDAVDPSGAIKSCGG